MAKSRCPRSECVGTSFEIQELKVSGANFRHMAIQCSSCGAVVSVGDYLNVGAAMEKLLKHFSIK